jgi:multidrug transporter EmrE-like cation transporter
MSATNLFLGILFAITGGIANNTGALFQKYAINQIPKEERENGYFKKLFKSPWWVGGLILIMVASGALISLAQVFIGAALIPGLMAVGMVVLTIGAVKILKEKLRLVEYFGIFLLIIGIVLIGLSALEITDVDMISLTETNFLIRFSVYSGILFILWIGSRQIGKRVTKGKTLFLALGSSFPFALSNIWMQPFIFIIREFVQGTWNTTYIILTVFSVLIIGAVNILAIGHLQEAFKYGDASIVYPIGAIPQQIAPVILFYGIYLKSSPQTYSLYLMVIGVVLILAAGFLLGRRQGKLEVMDEEIQEELTFEQKQTPLMHLETTVELGEEKIAD